MEDGATTRERPAFVADLHPLIASGHRFSTIYADPPWPYQNRAARGAAAAKHYSDLSLDAICREPVAEVATSNAHLHLWTTNGFLREAFQVIDAWGFAYKSCFVWIKPQLGAGNYWRVGHEFLLFAIRGNCPFQCHALPSWVIHPRTEHSRKPAVIREKIEMVSPGPYLKCMAAKRSCFRTGRYTATRFRFRSFERNRQTGRLVGPPIRLRRDQRSFASRSAGGIIPLPLMGVLGVFPFAFLEPGFFFPVRP